MSISMYKHYSVILAGLVILCLNDAGICAPGISPGEAADGNKSVFSGEPCTLWEKHTDPVWEGYFLAADPSVIWFDGRYMMYFTGYQPISETAAIGLAVSGDGINWDWPDDVPPLSDEIPMRVVFEGRQGHWDENIETVHVMSVGDELWMFYSGYVSDPNRFVSPYEVGLAKSTDGINWVRASEDPVLRLAESGPDNGAMTSPAVVQWNNMFYMIYLGWELDDAGDFVNFRIGGAVSDDPQGLLWNRQNDAVLQVPIADMPWVDAAVEPTLMQASDGLFYLFITADDGESPTSPSNIAVLRSSNPFGPWDACPEAIVQMTEPWEDNEIIAPFVMEKDGRMRMWYHGLTFNDPLTGERFRIGYAETDFQPCLPGDLNGDCRVDQADLGILLSCYEINNCGDLDGDGDTDQADLGILLANYNIQP